MPDDPVGERRLVLAARVDPVSVLARHVRGGEDIDEARVPGAQWCEVADLESRSRVRRPHRAHGEGILGVVVRTVTGGPEHARQSVDLGHSGAHRGARCGHGGARRGCATEARVTRGRDRLDDLRVAGAAAQHAADPIANGGVVGCGVGREQRVGRHEHPGRADAALRRAVGEEGRLEIACGSVGPREAFDRRDPSPGNLPERHQARVDLPAVHSNGARAAVPRLAADLGARHPEIVPQDVGQAAHRVGAHPKPSPIHDELHRDRRLGRHTSTRASARRTVVRAASRR